MARSPTSFGTLDERLRPVAQPIDTYMRPAEPQRSSLRDLAASLSGLEHSLDGYVADTQKKADEAAKLKGEADFYTKNQEGMAAGVSSGVIPSYASPAYVGAYNSTRGQSEAHQDLLAHQAEYMKWGGKDGTDPAAFDQWSQQLVGTSLAKRTEGMDDKTRVAYLKGYLPVLHQGLSTLQAQFHQDLSASVYKGNIEKHGIVTSQMIDQADADGYAKPTGTDYDGLWASIVGTRDNALKVGAKPEDYDKTLVKTIAEKAIEKHDPGILKLLDKTLPGQTYALSDTAIGASTKLETHAKLMTIGRQAQADAEHRQAKLDKKAKDDNERLAIDFLSDDPTKALPDDLLQRGVKYDPEFKIKVLDWQKKLAEGGVAEDPKAVSKLYADIFAGGGMGAVQRALSDGTLKTANGLKEATAYVKQMEGEGARGAKILEGSTVSTILDEIGKRSPARSPLSPFDTGGVSDAGLQAQTEYKRMLLDWAGRNPDASEADKEKARSDIGRLVLSGVKGEIGATTYSRPGAGALRDLGTRPEALGPENRGVAPPPSPTPESSDSRFRRLEDALGIGAGAPLPPERAGPAVPKDWVQPAPVDPALQGFKDGFSPIQRQGLEQKARERGLDPEAVWKEIFKQNQQPKPQVPHGSLVPMSYSPQGASVQPGRTYTPIPTTPDASGRVDSEGVRSLFLNEVQRQGLVGVVPPDGARYGITTGSAQEWADFFTRLSYRESSHNVGTVGDVGKFDGGSQGLLQLSRADALSYGLNGGQAFTDAQLRDPALNAAAGVTIAKSLLSKDGSIQSGLGRYWGPISKGWTPAETSLPGSKAADGSGMVPLQGLQVVNSMKPGATYGRTATASAQPFKYLVVHTSEMGGGANEGQKLVDYTQSHDAERGGTFGYHFLIDRDGTVHQIAPENARTNHIKGPGAGERLGAMRDNPISNSNAIGITTVGNAPNAKQIQVAEELGRQLMARYGITGSNVYGHGDLQSDREDHEGRDIARSLRGSQQPLVASNPPTPPSPEQTAGWVKRFASSLGIRL